MKRHCTLTYANISCVHDYTNISGYEDFITSSNSSTMDDEELCLAPGQCMAITIIIIIIIIII